MLLLAQDCSPARACHDTYMCKRTQLLVCMLLYWQHKHACRKLCIHRACYLSCTELPCAHADAGIQPTCMQLRTELTKGQRCTGAFTCTMPGPLRCCCPTASLPLLSFRLLLDEYLTRCGLVLAVDVEAGKSRLGGVSVLGVEDCDWKSDGGGRPDGVPPFQDCGAKVARASS